MAKGLEIGLMQRKDNRDRLRFQQKQDLQRLQ